MSQNRKRIGYAVLFHRHKKNPILTAADWPYPVHAVFNPGATLLPDGTTLLLAESKIAPVTPICARPARRMASTLDHRPEPTFGPDPITPGRDWGIEDPRITFVEELGDSRSLHGVRQGRPRRLAGPDRGLSQFERFGLVMQPDDKDAALLPRRLTAIRDPSPPDRRHGAHIWIRTPPISRTGAVTADAPGTPGRVVGCEQGGALAAADRDSRGWLMLYHGVRTPPPGALSARRGPLRSRETRQRLLRGDEWIFGPEAPYEQSGDVADVVFPCGHTIADDHDTLNLYYGAADTSVALATGSIREILEWLD